jgi:thermitase
LGRENLRSQLLGFVAICLVMFSLLAGVNVIVKFSSSSEGVSSTNRFETGFSKESLENNSGSVNSFTDLGFGLKNWRTPSVSEWTRVAKTDGCLAELVVGINGEDALDLKKLREIVEGMKGQVCSKIISEDDNGAFSVKIPFDSISPLIERLSASEFCRYVEPNWKITSDFIPNDLSWHLQWGPQKIQADFAWNTTLGDRSLLVAVIDTGINYMHPDLAANYLAGGYDWVNNDTDPMDDNGHGTHCAGIIAATINNLQGIAGLAQVRIMAEKGLDSEGGGYDDDLAQAIIHAVDHGARILSNSWGSTSPSQLIEDAIHYAVSRGVLVVAAAGNQGSVHPHYPAAYDDVVAVTATDSEDKPASFTNFGDWVEVAAPGVNIYSTYLNDYRSLSGTSMACPHVAGVAALILSRYPNMSETQLRTSLRYATDDLGDPGFDIYYGYGRINARKAVEALPLSCDLVLWNWSKPLFVEPSSLGLINATVYNFAMKAVDGVTVQLLANGTCVSEQTISHLEGDSFGKVTLQWIAGSEGVYNLTICVLPADGETNLQFNSASSYIHVGIPLRIAILDSSGTAYAEYAKKTWDELNREWDQYGNTMIYIDYNALCKRNITLQELEETGADVLLLASAWLREYTNEEITAIRQYVQKGHGFIITGPTLSSKTVPNNNKFAPLFGLSQKECWDLTWATDTLNAVEPAHPLLKRVQFPLNLSDLLISTCIPIDNAWDSDELWGGAYVAEGCSHQASIVTYRGLVYFSPDLENVGFWDPSVPTDESLQLLYNAMTWSKFQRPQHDLFSSVEAPGFLLPGETKNIVATVLNLGFSDESNVTVQIAVNGSLIYSQVIPTLRANTNFTISHLWGTSHIGLYNVSVYVLPAVGEDNLWNNEAFAGINVLTPPDILLVADNDEYEEPNTVWRTSLSELKVSLDCCKANYTVWEEKTKGSPPLDLLTSVKLVFWTVGEAGEYIRISDTDASNLVTYVKQGGRVFIDGDMVAARHAYDTQFLSTVLHCNSLDRFAHPQLLGGTEGLKTLARNNPITFGLPEEIRWETMPYVVQGVQPAYGGECLMNYLDNFEPPPSPEWGILPDKPVISWQSIIASENSGHGSTVFCPFPLFALPEHERTTIVRNSLRWLLPRTRELAVAFVPFNNGVHEQNKQAYVNISIGNLGSNDESNVKVQLMIDSDIINTNPIAILRSNSIYQCTYVWVPTSIGEYNITVLVSPAADDYPDNNWMSQIVNVEHLVVLLISDHHHEMESMEPMLDSIHIGYQSYYFNAYYGYTKNAEFISHYRVIIWGKSNRKMSQIEHDVIDQYINSGGSIVVTDVPLIYNVTDSHWSGFKLISVSNVDFLMADILRVSCTGALYLNTAEDRISLPVNHTHPMLNGLYGILPVGQNLTDMSPYCENATAITSRNAVLIARWVSPSFGLRGFSGYAAHKIVATEVGNGKVVYWGGQGQVEWMQNENCEKIFENMMTWFDYDEFHDIKVTVDVPALIEPYDRVQIKVSACNLGYHDEPALSVHLLIDGSDGTLYSISAIQKRSNRTFTYEWMPLQAKTYNITAYAPILPEEINTTNNICKCICNVSNLPHIAVETAPNVDFDKQFSIAIVIRNSLSVTAWQLELYYRGCVLNVTSISEGTFLSSAGSTGFQVVYASDRYNSTHGRLCLTCSLVNSSKSASGAGILVAVTVQSVGRGMCQLTLCKTHLVTVNEEECTHRVDDYRLVVGVLGDVNGDNSVSILDVVRITTIYGAKLGDSSYNSSSDINGDGTVTILDLVLCTANYGANKS